MTSAGLAEDLLAHCGGLVAAVGRRMVASWAPLKFNQGERYSSQHLGQGRRAIGKPIDIQSELLENRDEEDRGPTKP